MYRPSEGVVGGCVGTRSPPYRPARLLSLQGVHLQAQFLASLIGPIGGALFLPTSVLCRCPWFQGTQGLWQGAQEGC